MSLKTIWIDYCENGSIHGLRHVIQKDKKPWERLMWLLLLIAASITILVLVSSSWKKYSYSSMEIIIDDPRYPLAEIDFPAVTVYPINKIMYSKAINLVLNKYSNDSDLRTRCSNSIQALGMIQYPHNTDLYYFLKNRTTVNIPLQYVSEVMLKMDDKKRMALLVVNHLKSQLKSGGFSEEAVESMEVAIQCIESAYGLNPADSDSIGIKLENIVKEHFQVSDLKTNKNEMSAAAKKEAEYLKNCGNEFMKQQNCEKAIEAYSKSILLNSTNPIYYCNRAAAYNAIGKYNDAIMDCHKAIELDPTYCKAYCRLGLAYSGIKDFERAVPCYKKACDLDPENIGYQRNYELTLHNLQSHSRSQTEYEAAAGDPTFMETAARLIADPDVTSEFQNILENNSNGGNDFDRIMNVGHTLVTHLQTVNPILLDRLWMQFQNAHNEGQSPPHTGYPDDEDQS